MTLALSVYEPERLPVVLWKIQFPKRNDYDPALDAVKVAQLEVPMAKFGVPADAVQQFVNGGHDEDRLVTRIPADFLQAALDPCGLVGAKVHYAGLWHVLGDHLPGQVKPPLAPVQNRVV